MKQRTVGLLGGRTALAWSVGAEAHRRLRGAVDVRIHSQYDGALNLATEGGLVSIVPPEAGRGPLNLMIGRTEFRHLPQFPASSPVTVAEGYIRMEGNSIAYAASEIFNPTGLFSKRLLTPRQVSRNIQAARQAAIISGKFQGLGGLLFDLWGTQAAPQFKSPYYHRALPPAKALVGALVRSDSEGVRSSAHSLLGLGPGLTPSGDDFVAGLMVALSLGVRNGARAHGASNALSMVPRTGAGRTTTLSLEYLEQAAHGRANEKIVSFAESVYTGGVGEAMTRAVDVLRMGETSGTDLLVGVLAGAQVAIGGGAS